jgi:hypothetical protein
MPRTIQYINLQQHTYVPDDGHMLARTCCVNENMVTMSTVKKNHKLNITTYDA